MNRTDLPRHLAEEVHPTRFVLSVRLDGHPNQGHSEGGFPRNPDISALVPPFGWITRFCYTVAFALIISMIRMVIQLPISCVFA